jgi:hypothetical protein
MDAETMVVLSQNTLRETDGDRAKKLRKCLWHVLQNLESENPDVKSCVETIRETLQENISEF